MIHLLLAVLAALTPAAFAQYDFADEAAERMQLSFDLEEVEGMLLAPAPAPRQVTLLPLEPNSSVDSVTVFRDRALVTRVREVQLAAGTQSVAFEGLPLTIAADSLYAKVGGGAAQIIGVERVSGTGDVEETDRTAEIRAEMLELTEELGQIRDRIESLLAQRAYLRRTLLTPPADGRPVPALTEIQRTLGYIGDAEREIAEQLRREEERADELDEAIQPLFVKLENPQATGATVRVELEVERAGSVEVALHYQSTGAGWAPAYNARLSADGAAGGDGEVELEYFGVVTQHTGEDWADAELFLSTANPSSSGDLPRLDTWFLGRESYYGTSSVIGNLAGSQGYYDSPDNDMGWDGDAPAALLGSDMAASVQGSGVVVFAIPGRRTVAGDGSQHRLPVGTQTFRVALEQATVPKLAPEVIRRGRLRYAGEAPLLPGSVSTFVGADYVGSSWLDAVVPGEELLLSFGPDDRLKVERQLVSREQDYVGAMRRTVRYTFHFCTQVTNFSDAPQEIQLTDQIPVSEIDRVTVKLLETTPANPEDPNDGPGIMKWDLTIPPGETADVHLRFSVTAPAEVAEMQLQMLNSMY